MRSIKEEAVQKANKKLLAAIRKLPQQPLIVAGVLAGFAFFGTFYLMSSRAAAPGKETAYFVLEPSSQDKPFVIALDDPAKVAKARTFANRPWKVTGIIVKKPTPYNPDWGCHLDPATIEFVERPGTSCDADPKVLQERLQDVGAGLLPGGRWCPSAVTGLRELAK